MSGTASPMTARRERKREEEDEEERRRKISRQIDGDDEPEGAEEFARAK